MVDAAMSFRSQSAKAVTQPAKRQAGSPGQSVAVLPANDLAAYAALASNGSPRSRAKSAVDRGMGCERRARRLRRDGRGGRQAGLSLALEVVRTGPFRVARFMSGRHANGNFPAADPAFLQRRPLRYRRDDRCDPRRAAGYRRAGAASGCCPNSTGIANPLLALPHFQSPNVSLAVSLDGGFDALLGRASAASAKRRSTARRRASSRRPAASAASRRGPKKKCCALLDAFFAMKEFRFRKMGIANVFGEQEVQNFFRSLFVDALGENPRPFVLHALEVGGTLRAVTGSSLSGKRLVCEFGAIAEDDLAHASPGDFLFFDNIGEACRQGLGVVRLQCRRRAIQAALVRYRDQAFRRGRAADGKRSAARTQPAAHGRNQGWIKNSPTVWKLAKLLRKRTAGAAAAERRPIRRRLIRRPSGPASAHPATCGRQATPASPARSRAPSAPPPSRQSRRPVRSR